MNKAVKRKLDEIREFDPARVRPLPGQPRRRFRNIEELAASIKEVGQQTPGKVTLLQDNPNFDAELIDGERRLRACTLAGVPFRAEVKKDLSYGEKFMLSLAANFGRDDHTSTEVARALERASKGGETQEHLCKILGKSISWVTQHLNLNKLHPKVFEMLEEAENADVRSFLNFSTAQNLVNLPESDQLVFAKRIEKGEFGSVEELRRNILLHARKNGVTIARRVRSGMSRFNDFSRLVDKTKHRIGTYSDLPFESLNEIIISPSPKDFDAMLCDLKDMLINLRGLCETLERRRAAFLRENKEDLKGERVQ